MKKIIILVSIFAFVISCKETINPQKSKEENVEKEIKKEESNIVVSTEKFEKLDVSEINSKLLSKNIKSPTEIMEIYYPYESEEEGKESLEISDKKLENGNVELTLINDFQMDDSVKGTKIIMEVNKKNNKWVVVSLKKNWKCYKDRGHENWGVELCE